MKMYACIVSSTLILVSACAMEHASLEGDALRAETSGAPLTLESLGPHGGQLIPAKMDSIDSAELENLPPVRHCDTAADGCFIEVVDSSGLYSDHSTLTPIYQFYEMGSDGAALWYCAAAPTANGYIGGCRDEFGALLPKAQAHALMMFYVAGSIDNFVWDDCEDVRPDHCEFYDDKLHDAVEEAIDSLEP